MPFSPIMCARTRAPEPVRIGLLAVPEVSAGTLYALHEVFSCVGTAWAMLTGTDSPAPRMAPRILASASGPLRTSLGVRVAPDAPLDRAGMLDIVLVPDLALGPGSDPRGLWPAECAWLQAEARRGAVIASVCTGSVMLAEAGLLDGIEATSHWGVARVFAERYPAVRFRPDRVLIAAGPEGRIVTSGGAGAWSDLALHLVAAHCGREEARRTAKVFLFGDRSDGQLPFAGPLPPRSHADAAIARAQEWIAGHYAGPTPVARMAARAGLPMRSFQRRFRAATGFAPLDYVQTLRVEEAKQLLETTDLGTDEVALAVGYEDPASFRRVFRRAAGVTPARYRQKMRRILVAEDAARGAPPGAAPSLRVSGRTAPSARG